MKPESDNKDIQFVESFYNYKIKIIKPLSFTLIGTGNEFFEKKEIKPTNIEYNILELLIENAGKELSRAIILDNIWGYTPERYVDTRIVDVHISRLRAKIEDDPRNPDLILTARGIGYKFQQY